MKKRSVVLIIFIMIFSIVVGCSANAESFDDKNIIFKVVDTQNNKASKSSVIEITNETKFDLDNISLDISYPLSRSNDEPEKESVKYIKEFKIKSNETKKVKIAYPIERSLRDLDVTIKGNVIIKKDEKMPFGISGGLEVLIETP